MHKDQPEGNFYNKYESKNLIAIKLMEGFFDSMDELLNKISFKTVYEAGCGEGYISNHIKMNYAQSIIHASDISETKIKEAKTRIDNVEFSVESIYDIASQYKDKSTFDLVVACEVLEHLEKPEDALKELLEISNKYLLISVPNEPIWRILNMARGKYIKDFGNTPGHINHWSKRSFCNFIGNHCKVIEIKSPLPWTMLLCEK